MLFDREPAELESIENFCEFYQKILSYYKTFEQDVETVNGIRRLKSVTSASTENYRFICLDLSSNLQDIVGKARILISSRIFKILDNFTSLIFRL